MAVFQVQGVNFPVEYSFTRGVSECELTVRDDQKVTVGELYETLATEALTRCQRELSTDQDKSQFVQDIGTTLNVAGEGVRFNLTVELTQYAELLGAAAKDLWRFEELEGGGTSTKAATDFINRITSEPELSTLIQIAERTIKKQ